MLRLTGASGLGLLLGGGGVGGILAARKAAGQPGQAVSSPQLAGADIIPFYGNHQAGIITPAQNFLCFASFDLTTTKLSEVKNCWRPGLPPPLPLLPVR